MPEPVHVSPPLPALAPVSYDPELVAGLAAFLDAVEQLPLRADTILANRAHFASLVPPVEQQLGDRPIDVEHVMAPGPAGAPDIELTVLRPRSGTGSSAGTGTGTPVPGLYLIHGGGMVLGNRHFGVSDAFDLVEEHGVVAVSVEYRLAPEHPHPAPVEDCYAGLLWFAAAASRLGVDPDRIMVWGASAGGGLSAAVALLARDRRGPALAGQLLGCPMIDDRNNTVSSHQYNGIGAWDRSNNHTGWSALLGDERGRAGVSPYAAPARAIDLAGLPPAYIEVGAAEVFRDEAVDYASRLWAAGSQAELHVWAGGYHGFSTFSPDAVVSRAANAARATWLQRTLRLLR
ncbi:alpha/beta hydrolase [Subtercola sp. YIM 133946]|uniref:alpha/beta hydrolase n=1 Tax=Subtercola sp. YIM 133946 TaxID=3118909 RepID=UPI002F95956B